MVRDSLRLLQWTVVILVIVYGLLIFDEIMAEGRLDQKVFFRANEKLWETVAHPMTPRKMEGDPVKVAPLRMP